MLSLTAVFYDTKLLLSVYQMWMQGPDRLKDGSKTCCFWNCCFPWFNTNFIAVLYTVFKTEQLVKNCSREFIFAVLYQYFTKNKEGLVQKSRTEILWQWQSWGNGLDWSHWLMPKLNQLWNGDTERRQAQISDTSVSWIQKNECALHWAGLQRELKDL